MEKSYWDKILDSFGVGSAPKFTNQELGLGSIGNSGGNINSDVFLSGSSGKALNMSEPSNYLSPTNLNLNTTEGGLGSLFSGETMNKLGEYAGNAGKIFGAYQAVNDIFGSGAKSKKAAERRLEDGFKQNYDMNQMAMDKFKEDNAHFKQQRAAITSSYNA